MLLISEFQKFMFIYKQVMEKGFVENKNSLKTSNYLHITALKKYDSCLLLSLETDCLLVVTSSRNNNMLHYAKGTEKDLDCLVSLLSNIKD